MIAFEQGVLHDSNLYFHTASTQAQKAFFYPICTGHFYCDDSYQVERNNYNSFLIMFVKDGSGYVTTESGTYKVHENQIIFIDCYKSHKYYTTTGWNTLWLHFDGLMAREYFQIISSNSGNVISLKDTYSFHKNLNMIYGVFHDNQTVKEPLISKYITNCLTELILSSMENREEPKSNDIIEEIITYINEHIQESITLKDLSARASLSPYYFLRVFQKETGFTPYKYILVTRINLSKFYLKTTSSLVKEISINCGFTSESSFCSAFKKMVGMTPGEFRSTNEIG